MPEQNYVPDPIERPRRSYPTLSLGPVTQVFEDRFPANPDSTTKAALSFPIGGGTMKEWVPSLQAWV